MHREAGIDMADQNKLSYEEFVRQHEAARKAYVAKLGVKYEDYYHVAENEEPEPEPEPAPAAAPPPMAPPPPPP